MFDTLVRAFCWHDAHSPRALYVSLCLHAVYVLVCVCFSGSVPGMRPAEAGEFTRRAFQAGKMGLTEVGQGEHLKNAHRQNSADLHILRFPE